MLSELNIFSRFKIFFAKGIHLLLDLHKSKKTFKFAFTVNRKELPHNDDSLEEK